MNRKPGRANHWRGLATQAKQAGQARQADPAEVAVFFDRHGLVGRGGGGVAGCRGLQVQRERASDGHRDGQNHAAGLKLLRRGDDVIGTRFWAAFAEARGTEVERLCRRVKDTGVADIVEYPHQAGTGRVRWLEVRAFPALGEGIALFFHDVTLRRDAQERQRETAERLHFILEPAQPGAWEIDLAKGATQRSLLHDQCFGYDTPVPEWSLARFLEHVHPDDRARIDTECSDALARDAVFQSECRVVWPSGALHWIAIVGIVHDISERKQTEQKLRVEGRRKRIPCHAGARTAQFPGADRRRCPDFGWRLSAVVG